jgi:uroporphyrin-III C-methyltransferase
MKNHKIPKLTLVGAGPGDAELITLKGIKALQVADVVLYDALINEELLTYAPVDAPKIFVGKKFGIHYLNQQEINALIVKYALKYGNAVRLKGGDSFVFGRGKEEIEYAESFGIETIVIPGLSSSLSVPALQGIPMTHRGTSESFWVMTGTTQSHQLSNDIHLAVQSTATIVILMGMHKLAEIVAIFQEFNRQKTPVAIIQNGSLAQEKVAIGAINTILEEVENQGLSSPAIIIIGETVKLGREWLANSLNEMILI